MTTTGGDNYLCSNCGARVAQNDHYCSRCGADISEVEEELVVPEPPSAGVCVECGASVPEGVSYCQDCSWLEIFPDPDESGTLQPAGNLPARTKQVASTRTRQKPWPQRMQETGDKMIRAGDEMNKFANAWMSLLVWGAVLFVLALCLISTFANR